MHSPLRIAVLVFVATAGVALAILATPSPARADVRAVGPKQVQVVDVQKRHDYANMSLVVTNIGSLGFDIQNGASGLEFPIGSGQTALFASGLWMGATVTGGTRVTIAEYTMDYAPGRMVGGVAEPDSPDLRCYKAHTIHAPAAGLDISGWQDYVDHAAPYGAPVGTRRLPNFNTPDPSDSIDVAGPDLPGEGAIWCVYNDADFSRRVNNASTSAPLYIEVRQTAFSKLGGPAVYVEWQIRNDGAWPLDNAYVSLWSDADLGGPADDLVGYDAALEMGYTYNATNADNIYGATPPALGTMLVLGPLDPAAGVRRPAYAFTKYINGTDPNSPAQSYNYMQGLNADGTPVIDPISTLPTRFPLTGDPVNGTGWLDANPADRRMMVTTGPITLAPGQSTDLVVAYLVQQGTDRLDSIRKLRCKAQYAKEQYLQGFPIVAEPACDGAVPAVMFFEESSITTEGAVRLVWTAGDRQAGPYALERMRNPDTEWARLGLVSPDGVGRVVYEDADVVPGDRLAYRLVDPNSGAVLPGGDAHVVVPTTADGVGILELSALPPDGGDGAVVRFRLPQASDARLEMFDARGRRVAELDLGRFEAGTYVKHVGGAGQPSGLYFVRLVTPTQNRVVKALLVSER